MSLLDDAMALTSHARRLRHDEKQTTELDRVSTRISELRKELAELRELVRMFRVAADAGAPAVLDPAVVDGGRENLRRRASEGLPSDQAFTRTKSKVVSNTKQARTDLNAAWKSWARDETRALRRERLTRLPKRQRAGAHKDCARLDQLAGLTPAGEANVTEFVTLRNKLQEVLDNAPPVDDELSDLIRRLAESPTLSLADLTDVQIDLLREPEIAEQVELRWRLV